MQAQQKPNIQNQRLTICCQVLKTSQPNSIGINIINLIIAQKRSSKDVEKHDIVIKVIEGTAKTGQNIFQ